MKCPFCQEESFAKKKNIMDGWTVAKVVEVCALCGAELPQKEDKENVAGNCRESRRAGLAALLGGDDVETVTLAGSSDRDFCRNCANFIEHPFRTLCGISGDAADPMGSCDKFAEKK